MPIEISTKSIVPKSGSDDFVGSQGWWNEEGKSCVSSIDDNCDCLVSKSRDGKSVIGGDENAHRTTRTCSSRSER